MDKFSKEKRSKIMQAIKSKHTKPELLLRKELSKLGYRYRLQYGKEKIDIALLSKKIAIFIDGCFWHCCPKHGHIPKSNKKYWVPKLKNNVRRSKEKDNRLRKNGWKITHIWEHELKNLKKNSRAAFYIGSFLLTIFTLLGVTRTLSCEMRAMSPLMP